MVLPAGCRAKDISVAKFTRHRNAKDWYRAIPIFGPIIQAANQGHGNDGPQAGVARVTQQANQILQEAIAQWESAYAHYLQALGPVLARVTKDVLAPSGYVQTASTFATMPLLHLAHLLVAPMLALLVCAALLVWAV